MSTERKTLQTRKTHNNMTKNTIVFSTLLAAAMLAGLGCDNSDDGGSSSGKIYPAVGSRIDVQYRRDYLGLHAGDRVPMTGVMGEGAQVSVASSGVLVRMNEDFVVLQADNEPTRELWIPRGAILLMDVKKKQ